MAGGGPLKAVDDVTFDIHKGETLGLVGESGCGKSTLGRTVMRPLPAHRRQSRSYEGKDVTPDARQGRAQAYAKKMQIIFQDPYASLDPRMTVARHHRARRMEHPQDRHDARSAAGARRTSCWRWWA